MRWTPKELGRARSDIRTTHSFLLFDWGAVRSHVAQTMGSRHSLDPANISSREAQSRKAQKSICRTSCLYAASG